MPRSGYVSRTASIDAVVREGLTTNLHDVYHALVATTWPRLLGLIVLAYASINVAFAIAYVLVPGSIANARPGAVVDAFFFSVQTLATIGFTARCIHRRCTQTSSWRSSQRSASRHSRS
jgi:inward rectifier potassium channel